MSFIDLKAEIDLYMSTHTYLLKRHRVKLKTIIFSNKYDSFWRSRITTSMYDEIKTHIFSPRALFLEYKLNVNTIIDNESILKSIYQADDIIILNNMIYMIRL